MHPLRVKVAYKDILQDTRQVCPHENILILLCLLCFLTMCPLMGHGQLLCIVWGSALPKSVKGFLQYLKNWGNMRQHTISNQDW